MALLFACSVHKQTCICSLKIIVTTIAEALCFFSLDLLAAYTGSHYIFIVVVCSLLLCSAGIIVSLVPCLFKKGPVQTVYSHLHINDFKRL